MLSLSNCTIVGSLIIGCWKGSLCSRVRFVWLSEKYMCLIQQSAVSPNEYLPKERTRRQAERKEMWLNSFFLSLQDEEAPPVSFLEVMRLNSSEWPFILVGTLCAMINGAMQPVFAIIFSKIISVGYLWYLRTKKVTLMFHVNRRICDMLKKARKIRCFFLLSGVCRARPRDCQAKVYILCTDVCWYWSRVLCHYVSTGMGARTHTHTHTHTHTQSHLCWFYPKSLLLLRSLIALICQDNKS